MALVRRIFLTLLGVIAAAILAFAVYVASRQDVRFNPPAPRIAASPGDSAVTERGRYIARNLVACASCHADTRDTVGARDLQTATLAGGGIFDITPGKFHVPNITSDVATGIGGIPDSMIVRAWRLGVRHDGRPLLPFMELQELSDADLGALLTYVRTLPPVSHTVPPHEPNLLGKVVLATMLSKPVGPTTPPAAVSPTGATVENGRYLVEQVAGCKGCHTVRDEKTGALTGPHLGGSRAQFADLKHGRTWSSPNLTPQPGVGKSAVYSEDQFVQRFKMGDVLQGSPMPWEGFKGMHEDDVRAIYRYLRSLPPVANDPGPPFVTAPKKAG